MAAKFFQNAWSANLQILPANTTVFQTFATLTAFTKITSITVTSTDTSARDLQWAVSFGGVDYPLITATIAANAGNVSNVAPNILLKNTLWDVNADIANNKIMEFPSGAVLKFKTLTTVTAAKAINIFAVGETL